MNDQIKYVPILKWKTAEMTALKHVPESDKKTIMPVAEIVLPTVTQYKDKERKIKKTDEEIHTEMVDKLKNDKVHKISTEFIKVWTGNGIYVDVTWLHDRAKTNELKVDVLTTVITESKNKGVHAIPVVNISDNPVIIESVKKMLENKIIDEVCLRVSAPNLLDVDLNKKIDTVVKALDVTLDKTHLLADLKYIGVAPTDYKNLYTSAQKINQLGEFHSFIFASGAFPENMTNCPFEEPTYIPRADWLNWKECSKDIDNVRIPTYSDYSIRYPLYDERLQFFEPTSTIKYTLDSQWMIIKGRKKALDLYLYHASVFVLQPEFEKATFGQKGGFSYGDACIVEKAEHSKLYIIAKNEGRDIKGTGTAPLWIGYSISHHTALVIHQLSNPLD